jgi:hypothetical protein
MEITMKNFKYKTTITRNMDDNITYMVHHATTIVTHIHNFGIIRLNNGGWFSKTTKERMNGYISDYGYRLFQKNYDWYVKNVKTGEVQDYKNNMVLDTVAG